MMVIESKGTPKGMIVDCVAEVTMIPKADIEETPEITKIMDGTSAYIKGIGKKDNRLIILVDLKKLSTEGSDNVELEVNLEALETKTAPMPVSSAKARKKA
jgi:purine-binding chemotaxis protein CheW